MKVVLVHISIQNEMCLPLARQINCCLLNISPASIFKVLQCRSKLTEVLPECQTALILLRRRLTRDLIRV